MFTRLFGVFGLSSAARTVMADHAPLVRGDEPAVFAGLLLYLRRWSARKGSPRAAGITAQMPADAPGHRSPPQLAIGRDNRDQAKPRPRPATAREARTLYL